MKCGCHEQVVELRGVPYEVAIEAVAYVFAKRGEIELGYDDKWRCAHCGQRPGFWVTGVEAESESE
jgi:hypothetical protein